MLKCSTSLIYWTAERMTDNTSTEVICQWRLGFANCQRERPFFSLSRSHDFAYRPTFSAGVNFHTGDYTQTRTQIPILCWGELPHVWLQTNTNTDPRIHTFVVAIIWLCLLGNFVARKSQARARDQEREETGIGRASAWDLRPLERLLKVYIYVSIFFRKQKSNLFFCFSIILA